MNIFEKSIVGPVSLDPGDQDKLGPKLILVAIISALLICPLTFQLTQLSVDGLQTELLTGMFVLILAGSVVCVLHNILRERCQPVKAIPQEEKVPRIKIFKVFSSATKSTKSTQKIGSPKAEESKKSRVDPRYFKPRFIYNELMSIWGTTYTVVTWSSFWVIGGTIVATERLVVKFKTKYARNQNDREFRSNSTRHSSDYSGTRPHSTEGENLVDPDVSESTDREPFRNTRIWTRRSFAVVRKRFNKIFRAPNMPQLTQSGTNTDTSARI